MSALHRLILSGVLLMATAAALAAQQKKPMSAATPPPQQPVEVKVVSIPNALPPQVTVNVPADESTRDLVKVTWLLVGATVLTALVAAGIGIAQSLETKRRDRATLMREVSRAAHRVKVEATRLIQIAETVPRVRNEGHILAGQQGTPATVAHQMQNTLTERRTALETMAQRAGSVAANSADAPSPLRSMSDEELSSRLWQLDEFQVRLDAMRDAITEELTGYRTENARLRDHRNELQAASVAGRLAQPPKTNPGE